MLNQPCGWVERERYIISQLHIAFTYLRRGGGGEGALIGVGSVAILNPVLWIQKGGGGEKRMDGGIDVRAGFLFFVFGRIRILQHWLQRDKKKSK